jgi:hypothetical protein
MSPIEKSKTYTFSLIAGILMLINALLLWAVTTWFPWIMPTIPGTLNDSVPFNILTTVGLICGVIILLGSIMQRSKPINRKALGITLIAFSIPSVVMGGGFIIGFILGIISGVSTLRKPSKLDN